MLSFFPRGNESDIRGRCWKDTGGR